MALLIENGMVLQQNFGFKRQTVVVDGPVISAIGPKDKMRRAHKGYDRIDASGSLVMPGFINAHMHAALGLARGFGVGLPLFDMFEKKLFPLYKEMTDQRAYLGAMVSGLEMIHTGSTSVNNVDSGWAKPVLKAFNKLGLRGTMAITLKDRDVETGEAYSCSHLPENEWLVKRLAEHPRLKGMYGIANEFEATEGLIKTVRELAERDGAGIHMHLAESKKETGFIMQKTGKTSVRYMYDLGVLKENSLAVHVVNISQKDIPLLAKSRATVVHCPTSNLNLGSGIAHVPEMLEAGVSVAVGIDHPIANISNDIRHELNNAMVVQQARGKQLLPKQLLAMALNSRLYGYLTGALQPGSMADIIVVSLKGSAIPEDNATLLREALLAALPVTNSIINGEAVMRDGRVLALNERSIIKKARAASKF